MRLNRFQKQAVEEAAHDARLNISLDIVCEEIEAKMNHGGLEFEKALTRVVSGWETSEKKDAFIASLGFAPDDISELASAISGDDLDEEAAAEVSEKAESLFVEGWVKAGGYTGDMEGDSPSPRPWCAPWTWGEWGGWGKFLDGRTIAEAAADHWQQNAQEIENLCAEEEKDDE